MFQAVLGTMISAMTGSEDPKEVAQMAKQATEVIKKQQLVRSLIEIHKKFENKFAKTL